LSPPCNLLKSVILRIIGKIVIFRAEPCVLGAQGIESSFFTEGIMKLFTGRYRREAVEVVCPICKHSQIVYFPEEEMPKCPKCKKKMIVKEVLTEGKY